MNGIVYATRARFEFIEEGMASEWVYGSSRMVPGREEMIWEGIYVLKW